MLGSANTISYDVGFCGESQKGTATIADKVVTFTKK